MDAPRGNGAPGDPGTGSPVARHETNRAVLAGILHELVDAAGPHVSDNRRGALHGLVDQLAAAVAPELAEAAAELAADAADTLL